ncbi:MAG: hypothetical protein ACLQQ4_19075 [Bacteroidia bacterium]
MKANFGNAYISSDFKNPGFLPKVLKGYNDILTEDGEKYLLSFFDIFKNSTTGEKIFSYLNRMGLVRRDDDGKFTFIPKTRSSVLPIVCLYKTLNEKGYLKRMTQTEAGYYFCKAFGQKHTSIRMFYCDQMDSCKKYNDYFFHIPEHTEFVR